mgnify:CR=1 FL=1
MECTKYVRTFQIIGNLLLNKVYFRIGTRIIRHGEGHKRAN